MKKMFFLMLTLLVWSVAMNAQVTIGSMDNPHEGSLLDLSKGTNRGVLLPRVSLNDVSVWQLEGSSVDGTGMMVYNTNNNTTGGSGSGVYVWNGSAWASIKSTVTALNPGDYGTPNGTTYNPLMSGVSCIDVRSGQADPGTQQYVVTETGSGSKTIKEVIWTISKSADVLTSNGVSGTGNVNQNLVFKSQAELLALAASTDQTVTLTAYIEYSDNTKVQISKAVKIQNRSCCPGYLITNGAFEGGPSAVAINLNVSSTLALFPAATKNLCVGPDFGPSRTWYSVTGNFCNTNVHGQGGDWDDGDNTWRLPNIAELANMQAIQSSIPNFATSYTYWSSTDYSGDSSDAAVWYTSGSGSTNHRIKTAYTNGVYTRCVRTIK
ncbi:hypothetical protein FACS189440_15460 [Bacteroidia bacterium]|nr:hypothetical protein FACS189423_02260 [Bacteroidia bacterium]GHT49541.1 hypothetical protein FACS189440_15460 [Bacteroidia bacterium]